MLHIVLFLSFLCIVPSFATHPWTWEEKVGQLLMVHFCGETANEDARTLIQEYGIGGIIYYNWANGLHYPQQVQNLSCSLQQLARQTKQALPLFIAIDQEDGAVTRLTNGFTAFPGNHALGATHDPDLALAAARARGEELHAVGINLNLAPVVDVNMRPANRVIGQRSFGDDSKMVSTFGAKALDGFKSNIMTTLKHFPGHGSVASDSHSDLPVNPKSMEELEKNELLPFARLAASTDLIMTAHLLVPAFDKEHCTTLSKKTLDYLRNKIGFQGVIITDSLVMEGVLKQCQTIDEAAIQALSAGADILLLGGRQLNGSESKLELSVNDIKRIHSSLVSAIQSGRLPEDRVNEAFERVVNLKKRYLNFQNLKQPPNLSEWVNIREHRQVAEEIAVKAKMMALVINSSDPLEAFMIPQQVVNEIGERIWKNECAGSIEGLTHWNKGENFASLGIGHFIWYAARKKEQYQETFPELVAFLEKKGAVLPDDLSIAVGCPWSSREEFYGAFHTPKMKNLRQFLFETRELQALFMVKKLQETLPLMLENCSGTVERAKISALFFRLAKESRGLYALLDYLNFKGPGISNQESYKGQRWGLFRVLQEMPNSLDASLHDFVNSAKRILIQRVANAPPERHEEAWLEGWLARLNTYID